MGTEMDTRQGGTDAMTLPSTHPFNLYSSMSLPPLGPSFLFFLFPPSSFSPSFSRATIPLSFSPSLPLPFPYSHCSTMASPSFRPFFSNFISFLLLFLGCFFIFPSSHNDRPKNKKPKFNIPIHPSGLKKLKPQKALNSSWSFLKRVFSPKSPIPTSQTHPASSFPSPTSSIRSIRQSTINPPQVPATTSSDPLTPPSQSNSNISSSNQLCFPLRNDIYPCPNCGEIFHNPNLLELHQSIKHAVSELIDEDSGKNIIHIIFSTGWPAHPKPNPNISQVLKIHNSPKILTKFEEYRETVKLKASRNGGAVRRRHERCIADGNEQLRFHCATFLCDLGQNGNSSICNHQYCSVCGIIRSGFSQKMDGISTLSTSWRAHVAIPDDLEDEFKFMHVKRAMMVCRVIAGRVGCEQDVADKEDSGYDSLIGREAGVDMRLDEDDELLVFNPRAVLPCFVIVYSV